ncbi:MAG: PTS sugar transporter subunit IIB [Anaerolineaceae bacterium]
MAKKMKIVTVCGCGLGSSLMAKTTIEKIMKEFGVVATIEASDAGTAKGYPSDLIITTTMLKPRVGEIPGTPVIAVKSFMNVDELREVMRSPVEEFKRKNNL